LRASFLDFATWHPLEHDGMKHKLREQVVQE
jgi:hypothetical protein